MLYIILGILFFGLLIAVHEWGHFITAKKLDVQVNEFSIGMGPAIWSRQKGETKYSLRALPIGGYCAMEGEDGDDGTSNPRSFAAKALWKKLIILAAGSFMNLVAGFLIVVLLYAGSYACAPTIAALAEGCPAAGVLEPGDRILSIDGHRVAVYFDVSGALSAGGDEKTFVVKRDGQKLTLADVPLPLKEYTENGQTVKRYGLTFTREEATPLGVLAQGAGTCDYFARAVWQGLSMLVRGQVGLTDMSGPVGIVSTLERGGQPGGDRLRRDAERAVRDRPHRGEPGSDEYAPHPRPGRGAGVPAPRGRAVLPGHPTPAGPEVRGLPQRRVPGAADGLYGGSDLQRRLEAGQMTAMCQPIP